MGLSKYSTVVWHFQILSHKLFNPNTANKGFQFQLPAIALITTSKFKSTTTGSGDTSPTHLTTRPCKEQIQHITLIPRIKHHWLSALPGRATCFRHCGGPLWHKERQNMMVYKPPILTHMNCHCCCFLYKTSAKFCLLQNEPSAILVPGREISLQLSRQMVRWEQKAGSKHQELMTDDLSNCWHFLTE